MLFIPRVLPPGQTYLFATIIPKNGKKKIFHLRATTRQGKRVLQNRQYVHTIREACAQVLPISADDRFKIRVPTGRKGRESLEEFWNLDDDKARDNILDIRALEIH